jgi:hypothetical protein
MEFEDFFPWNWINYKIFTILYLFDRNICKSQENSLKQFKLHLKSLLITWIRQKLSCFQTFQILLISQMCIKKTENFENNRTSQLWHYIFYLAKQKKTKIFFIFNIKNMSFSAGKFVYMKTYKKMKFLRVEKKNFKNNRTWK